MKLSQANTNILKTILYWVKNIFTPLSLCIILFLLWRSKDLILESISSGEWRYLLISLLFWVFSNILTPLVTSRIFSANGLSCPYRECLRIHCQYLPAKYLPGGIWHSVGRAGDYLGLGHTTSSIGRFFIIENFLLVAITLFLSSPVISTLVSQQWLQRVFIFLSLACLTALILIPTLLKKLTKINLKLDQLHYFTALLLLACYWILAAISFTFYIQSFPNLQLDTSQLQTAAIYIFSWCIGYLAIFAPQGIGVSEFTSGYLLAGSSAAQIIGLIAGFRLLALCGDLLSWLLFSNRKLKNFRK